MRKCERLVSIYQISIYSELLVADHLIYLLNTASGGVPPAPHFVLCGSNNLEIDEVDSILGLTGEMHERAHPGRRLLGVWKIVQFPLAPPSSFGRVPKAHHGGY